MTLPTWQKFSFASIPWGSSHEKVHEILEQKGYWYTRRFRDGWSLYKSSHHKQDVDVCVFGPADYVSTIKVCIRFDRKEGFNRGYEQILSCLIGNYGESKEGASKIPAMFGRPAHDYGEFYHQWSTRSSESLQELTLMEAEDYDIVLEYSFVDLSRTWRDIKEDL